jgi:sugar-specific transcriptional regulator TrmB
MNACVPEPALYNALRTLECDETESAVYVNLIALGPCSAKKLSDVIHTSEPTIYKALLSLRHRGLLQQGAAQGYTRVFAAEPPALLLGRLEEKKEVVRKVDLELRTSMSELMSSYNRGKNPTETRIVRGAVQMRALYIWLIENEKKSVRQFGRIDDGLLPILTNRVHEAIVRNRVKHEVTNRILCPSDNPRSSKRDDEKELRKVRFVAGVTPFSGVCQVFSERIVYWKPTSKQALVIDDGESVDMMCSMYDALWRSSSDPVQKKEGSA